MPVALASYLSLERVGDAVLNAISPEVMLDVWLSNHPKVANSMMYNGQHFSGTWPSWPADLKKHLADRWEQMLQWYGQGMPHPAPPSFPDPIPREAAGDPRFGYGLVMSKDRGRHIYLSHVANGLALETSGKLPWSIANYSAKELEDLFSCEFWLWYGASPDATVEGYYIEELNSPATPAHVMQFFTKNDLLGTSARDTVARLFGWCSILQHWEASINGVPLDAHDYWGPDAPPIPSSMLINGTNCTGVDPPVFGHYAYGCAGTSYFMKSALRAVNIPVDVVVPPCGHTIPQFPTIHRALSHGDDPYTALTRFTEFPGWPIPSLEDFLITMDQYNEWFGPSVDPIVSYNNLGRRPAELAVQYQSDYLLDLYCNDTAASLDHASGKVYEVLKTFYTVADLEAQQLWDKLATKAVATNWCASASAHSVIRRSER